MLRGNTLASIWSFLLFFDDAVGDERIVDSRNRMRIEQGLDNVGRGRLLSRRRLSRFPSQLPVQLAPL
jgi:hypothetical protein